MLKKAVTFLRNLRQEKGFTLEEVSKATKMSPSVLRELEEGSLDKIDPVYLKGFLKLYCRFLDVNWEDFIKDYPVLAPVSIYGNKSTQEKVSRSVDKKPWRIFILAAKNKKIILNLLYLVAAVFLLILLLRGCSFLIKKIPKGNTKPAKAGSSLKNPEDKIQEVKPRVVKKENAQKSIKVGILLKEKSYIKVIVDGRLIYSGVLRKGKQEDWTAKEKIEMYVGNAGAVELEFDGKRYAPLGRRGQTIKQILIDRGGLKIL